jgi:hypothetical protein
MQYFYWRRHAFADVLRDAPELCEIGILSHKWTTVEPDAQGSGVGLEGEGADQYTTQAKETGLPHCLDDHSRQRIGGGQARCGKRAHQGFPAFIACLDGRKARHAVGNTRISDRAYVFVACLLALAPLIVPIQTALGSFAHESAVLAKLCVELCVQAALQ